MNFGENYMTKVIGLMKDYNQTGLYDPVESLLLYLSENNRIVYVKLNEHHTKATINLIEAAWIKVFPDQPFLYTYLKDDLFEQIRPDEKRGVLFAVFSLIVIAIAILGVFGLASFTIEQRTKEIAVRKVLGAGLGNIIKLIFIDYLILIMIAILIAFPTAFLLMQKFLENYEYQTQLKIDSFVIAALGLMVITFCTIIYHTLKVAKSNPVDSLRIE